MTELTSFIAPVASLAPIALTFVIFEVIAFVVFWIILSRLGGDKIRPKPLEAFKGILERLALLTGLVLQFPQILIFFGALKIGTRLSAETGDEGSNYFIIGNFTSVLFAFATYAAVIHLTNDFI